MEELAMANCGNCGRENPADMRFCTNCGSTLSDSPSLGGGSPGPQSVETLVLNAAQPTTPTKWPNIGDAYRAPVTPAPEKSRTGLIVGVVSAVLLIGLVAAGGVGYYFYSKTDDKVADGNTNQGVRKILSDDNANDNSKPKPSPTPSPTPVKLFDPPTEPTKDGTFTVYANGDWQLSTIAVVPLERFTTTVDGIIDLAGAKAGVRSGGTNDAQWKSRRLFAEWPTGALLMRTRYADGRFSNTVAVTAGASGSWQNLPDERGMIEFRINDNQQKDNGGQFTIRKKSTSVPKS
jgi:hypothetical protein